MTLITILDEAELELWDAVAYYEDKASGLGLDFEAEVEKALLVIGQSPERWPLRGDGTRRYLIHRFPFVVVYTYLNDHIWIIACAHCKRRPEYWSDRLRPVSPDPPRR
jgi:toxin ParE1/3/4